jgi:hypothetical protein
VKVDIPIFIAIPRLNDTARQIAKGHGILLIEGLTEELDTLNDAKVEIENRIHQKLSEIALQQQSEPEKKPEPSLFGKIMGIKKKVTAPNSK